jgi:hypothetical protein
MKIFFLFLSIFLFTSTTLFASKPSSWTEVFYETYDSAGIDRAVRYGLREAKSPDDIVKAALVIEGMDEPLLIHALYCALVLPDDIYIAAVANDITEETVSKGYDLALAVCAERMEENLAIVMATTTQPASTQPQGATYASPSTF